ncbi:MAG TPA: FAD-binding oxidoreductase, partial [Isosphaeraceae bacterium]|nr:FAD-binding oxidoreductase [Isosphaeraceae bacterium]
HLRALGAGTPGLDLIRGIPQLEVEFIDRGCSGMAGTYGLSARHLRSSLRGGRGLLRRLRDPDLQLGSTECSACRLQMEQFSDKPTIHPLKLLALGYGISPSIRRHLGRSPSLTTR